MEKRGRALDAKESQQILESTATRKTLVSWFEPFHHQMLDAINKRKKFTILGGRNFAIRQTENGQDYIFMVADSYVPMTRINLDNLKTFVSDKNALIANQ